MTRSCVRVPLAVFLLSLSACPPSGTSAKIGPEGGELTGPGGVKLVVPAGALPSQAELTIASSTATVPSSLQALGSTVTLGPSGTQFNVPVELTLPYDAAAQSKPTALSRIRVLVKEASGELNLLKPRYVRGGKLMVDVLGFTDFTPVSQSTRPVDGESALDGARVLLEQSLPLEAMFAVLSEGITATPKEVTQGMSSTVAFHFDLAVGTNLSCLYWASDDPGTKHVVSTETRTGSLGQQMHTGSFTVTPAKSTLYVVQCETWINSVEVQVKPPAPPPPTDPPEVAIDMSTSLEYPVLAIDWRTSGAGECEIDPWDDSEAPMQPLPSPTGSQQVPDPTEQRSWELQCYTKTHTDQDHLGWKKQFRDFLRAFLDGGQPGTDGGSPDGGSPDGGSPDGGSDGGTTNEACDPSVGPFTHTRFFKGSGYGFCARSCTSCVACWGAGMDQTVSGLFTPPWNKEPNKITFAPSFPDTDLSFLYLARNVDQGCGIGTGGAAWCWGSQSSTFYPLAQVPGLSGLTEVTKRANYYAVGAGGAHSFWPPVTGTPMPSTYFDTGSGMNVQITGANRLAGIYYRASDGSIHKTTAPTSPLLTDAGTPLTTAVQLVDGYYLYALRLEDGTVWYLDTSVVPNVMRQISSQTGFQKIDAAFQYNNICGVKGDGSLWCWGASNTWGQLGNGNTSPVTQPTQITSLSNVVDVAMSDFTTCALKQDGSYWCWGHGPSLGDPTFSGSYSTTPRRVPMTWPPSCALPTVMP